MTPGIGTSTPRVEDRRLLTGRGRFTDDFDLPGQAHAVVVRAAAGHADITRLDTTAARAFPGVLAVLTAEDLVADGIGTLPCRLFDARTLYRPDGTLAEAPPHPVLASARVRFAGEPLALVVAETGHQAEAAAGAVIQEWVERAAVTTPAAALAPGAPAVWEQTPDNVALQVAMGDAAAVEAAMTGAAHRVRLEVPVSRVVPCPMEPRAALGVHDPADGRYTLYCGVQQPHTVRRTLAAAVFGVPETDVRVVSPDMGGAFGMRSDVYPEMAMVLWAARRLGRPVKWRATRSESFLADNHGRDALYRVELALDREGRFLALRCHNVTSIGAYFASAGAISAFAFLAAVTGVYRIPAAHAQATCVYANTPPVAPYRGAGRPEAILAIETIIDHAARELGIDRVDLRRRNLVAADALPYRTALGYTFDSGDFAGNMDRALQRADAAGFEDRRARAAARGRLRGLGVVNAVEAAGGVFIEAAELRFDPGGGLTASVGTHSHGQGHETVYRQILASKLGVGFDRIRILQGDTDQVPFGTGTFASRSTMMAGAAMDRAADVLIEKGRRIAAHRLEAAAADIEVAAGRFTVAGTDRSLDFRDVARIAYTSRALPPDIEPGLVAFSAWDDPVATFPNGCHIAEVEIDAETGRVELVAYSGVEDAGAVLNPLLLEGQMHGGIVQGVGQVLHEAMIYGEGDAQPLSASFLDYCLPRADDLPEISLASNPHPSTTHPLGVKGVGEAGTVGALACVLAAVNDALTRAGAPPVEMPATPARVWNALRRRARP